MRRAYRVKHFAPSLAALLCAAALLQPFAASARHGVRQQIVVSPEATTDAPAPNPAVNGRTFIAAPSSLVGQGGATRLNFSGALSIHNASGLHALTIEKIDYRNDAGVLIENYLDAPITLKPYASMQVVIAQHDMRGGPGASFTIDWTTPQGADEPTVEAFVASFIGTQSYSFTTAGRRVARPR